MVHLTDKFALAEDMIYLLDGLLDLILTEDGNKTEYVANPTPETLQKKMELVLQLKPVLSVSRVRQNDQKSKREEDSISSILIAAPEASAKEEPIEEVEIEVLRQQFGLNRNQALDVLKQSNGDLVNAILKLAA